MTTVAALTLVTDALRKLGVIASGEALAADQGADGLAELNRMLEVWALQHRMVYRVVDVLVTLTPTVASYTIGPGGDVNTTRPVRLNETGFTRRGTLDFPLTVINRTQYDSFLLKSLPTPWPSFVYYDAAVPLGTLTFFPTPTEGNVVHLAADVQFTAFTALATSLSFPPGYQDGLTLELALRLAPDYGVQIPPAMALQLRMTMRAIKQANAVPVVADIDPRLAGTPGKDAAWIYHGGYV